MKDQLLDLENEVKKIYPHIHSLRKNGRSIDFSIKTISDKLEWFPYYLAPEHVMNYIHSYLKMNTQTLSESGYFPPPWNPNDNIEKTQGWLAFQDALKADPAYYLMDMPNVVVKNEDA